MRKFIVGLSLASVLGLATFTSCNKSGEGSPRNVEDAEKVIELKLKSVPEEGKSVWFFTVAQNTIETSDKIDAYNDSILKVMPPEDEPKFTLIAYMPDEKSWTPALGLMSGNYALIEVDKTLKNLEGTSAVKIGYYVENWGHIDATPKQDAEGEFNPVSDFSNAGSIASVVETALSDLNDDYDVNDIVRITASAQDKDGGYIKSVTFDVGGQTFVQTQKPFYVDFNTKGKNPGKYIVKVIAINGNEYGNSDVTEFILNRPEDGNAPNISIGSPTQGDEVVIGEKVNIVMYASDSDGKIVETKVLVDGVQNTPKDNEDGSYSYEWSVVGLPGAMATISFTAKDNSENIRTVEVNVKLKSAE